MRSSSEENKGPSDKFGIHLSNEHLDAVFDSLTDIIFYLAVEANDKYRFVYINKAFLKATGLHKDQILDKYTDEVIPPDSHKTVLANYQKAIATGQPVAWEEKSYYPAGYKIATVKVTPCPDGAGKYTHLIGIIHDLTDIKASETALRESILQFEAAFEQSANGLCFIDSQGKLLKVNETMCELLGYDNLELTGKHYNDITYAEDFEIGNEVLKNLNAGKIEKATFEKRYINKKGHVVWAHINSAPVKDDSGRILYFITEIEDITSQKKAEFEIRQSEIKLRTLLESVSDAFIALDKNWKFTYVNKKAGEILKRNPEILLGKDIETAFPKIAKDSFFRSLYRALESQKTECLQKYYPEFERWLESNIYPTPGGISLFFRDITESIKTRQAIIHEKELSETITKSLPGVFYLYNRAGRFLRWNANFETVTGYSAEEISAMHPLDFFDVDEKELLRQKIDNVFAFGEDNVEAFFMLKNGRKIPYYFTGVSTQYEGQQCLLGVGIDMSDQQNYLKKIEEHNKKLIEIAWLQSHMVRAPLARLMGLVNLISYSRRSEEAIQELLTHITVAANELDEVIREIVRKTEHTEAIYSKKGRK